jgi:UDP-3-O-[3-hydroxymyristoyl] N-acetylglucosamine deacetylase
VRHKILDTLGDLSLAGLPIAGAFEGERTGHEANHQLVSALLADAKAWCIEEASLPTHANGQVTGNEVLSPA